MKTVTAVLVLFLFLSGCSNDSAFEGIADDSGRDAVIEEAAIALDDQDYTSVIYLLTELYDTTSPDPRVSRLLSSAHMGKAGVDFVGFMRLSDEEDLNAFDRVGLSLDLYPAPELEDEEEDVSRCDARSRTVLIILDEHDRNYEDYTDAVFIDGHCIGELISSLEEAQYILDVLIREKRHSFDDEIQLGLASAAHFVLKTGNTAADALNVTLSYKEIEDRKPGMIPVPINREAYRYYINYSILPYNWSRVDESDFGDEPDDPGSLSPYQKDLIDVLNAVRAFEQATTEQNDVRDALDDFLSLALLMPTTGIDENTIISTMTTSGVYDLVSGFSAE